MALPTIPTLLCPLTGPVWLQKTTRHTQLPGVKGCHPGGQFLLAIDIFPAYILGDPERRRPGMRHQVQVHPGLLQLGQQGAVVIIGTDPHPDPPQIGINKMLHIFRRT